MNKFSTLIAIAPDHEKVIAAISYSNDQRAEVSGKNGYSEGRRALKMPDGEQNDEKNPS